MQREHGYLPADSLRTLADRMRIPLYHVQGVATFFPHFRLAPPPAVDVQVCDDMSCHLRGGDALHRTIEARVAGAGHTGVVVRGASCLGQCDSAPAAAVNHAILTGLTPDSLAAHIDNALAGGTLPEPEVSTRRGGLPSIPMTASGFRPSDSSRRGTSPT